MNVHSYFRSLAICLLLCIHAVGMQAQQKVTVKVTNATLLQVFKTIEGQTTYKFSYKSNVIDNRNDITINKTNAPVTTVLDAALKDRALQYTVVSSKSIVIAEKQNRVMPANQGGEKTKVQGVVKDDKGEPVIGATVSVVGTNDIAVTDMDGRFSLQAVRGGKN